MNAPRVKTALALVTALALIGCKNKAAAPAPEKSSTAPVAAKSGGAAEKPADAKKADAPKAGDKADAAKATPAPAKPAGDSAMLEQYAADKNVREERRKVLVSHYEQLAEQAFAASRFEDAKKFYGDILDLDPKHEGARRRMAQLGAMMGDRDQTARDALESAVDSWRTRCEQAKAEVGALAGEARAKEAAGDYEGAADKYDRALIIVGLYPSTVDFSPTETGLRQLKSKAKENAAAAADARRARTVREAEERARAEEAKERAERQSRRSTLLRKANAAMEAGNYAAAHNFANELLADDPTNRQARQLREIALNAKNDELNDHGRATYIEEWKKTFEQLAEATTPQTEDYRFPAEWSRKQALREPPKLTAALEATESPQDRAVRNALDAARTQVQFEAVKLDDAISFLSRMSGVNIVILPQAREGKSDEELTIGSLKFDQALPVSQILDLITKLISGLAWNVENGVAQITTADEARGEFVVQLYDVKDIATPIPQFPGEAINLDPTGELTIAEEPPEAEPVFGLDPIVELVQQNVDRDTWENGGEVSGLQPGTLVVKAPRATHKKVQQLLTGLRGAGGLQVSIETRFVTVTDNFLQDVGVDLRGLGDQSGGVGLAGKGGLPGTAGTTIPVTFDDVFFGVPGATDVRTDSTVGIFYNMNSDGDLRARFENLYDKALGKDGVLTTLGGLSFQGTLIDDTQLEVILRAVQKSDRSTLVLAPKLTAYAGQRANITVLNQVSYISDFDVEIAQAAQIGDPIVQTLRDGVILDVKPIVTADRRFITMELRPTIAILTRPILTFQTTLGQGPPVTIQLPELAIQRLATTVTMPDGGTLLLGGLKFFEERNQDSSVPWLNKIPILSFVLSRKGTFAERRNLLVLIRARIVRPEENEPAAAR